MMRQRGNNSYCQQTPGNLTPGKKKENCRNVPFQVWGVSSVGDGRTWQQTRPLPRLLFAVGRGQVPVLLLLGRCTLQHCSTAGGHSRWWPLPLQLQHTGLVTDAAITSLIPRPVSLNTNPDSFTHAGVATVAWPGNWGLLTSTAENCKRDNTRAFYCHFILL